MAMHKINQTLEFAYRDTAFEVDHPEGAFVIRIGEMSDKLDALMRRHGAKYWTFVTACNPRSVRFSSEFNFQRQSELRAYLLSMRFIFYPGRGVPAEPGWQPEDSFLVLGISRQQAERLGAMLEQNAIAFGEAGKAASLVFCELPAAGHIEQTIRDDPRDIRTYIYQHIEELWENAEVSGIWIRESDVPDRVDSEDLGILEGKISARRFAALEAGKNPTPAELQRWREAWIQRALGDWDADAVPGYAISKVTPPGRKVGYALILATGYSFAEVERWIEGIFPSCQEAEAHISASGWHN